MFSDLKLTFCWSVLLCIVCAETAILGESSVLGSAVCIPATSMAYCPVVASWSAGCIQEMLPLGQSHLGMTSRVSWDWWELVLRKGCVSCHPSRDEKTLTSGDFLSLAPYPLYLCGKPCHKAGAEVPLIQWVAEALTQALSTWGFLVFKVTLPWDSPKQTPGHSVPLLASGALAPRCRSS